MAIPPRTPSRAVPNPYAGFSTGDDIYEAHEADGPVGGGGVVADGVGFLPPAVAESLGTIEEQGWYWGNISR